MHVTIIRIFITGINYAKTNLLFNWSLTDFFRIIRNSFLILMNGYSPFIPVLLVVFIFYLLKNKKWPEAIVFMSFLFPFLLTAKFWYGGLYGRYSSFIAFPLALLIGLISNRKLYWLTIFSVLIIFIPTLTAYQQVPYPTIEKQILKKINFNSNDLIILSDYQRPQLPYKNALYITGDQNEQKTIEKKIYLALKNKKRVLISEQAVSFPYWQYDGQQIHIISKGNKDRSQFRIFLGNKKLILVSKNSDFPLLNIYQCF